MRCFRFAFFFVLLAFINLLVLARAIEAQDAQIELFQLKDKAPPPPDIKKDDAKKDGDVSKKEKGEPKKDAVKDKTDPPKEGKPEPPPPSPEEQTLKAVKLPIDGSGLLEFFRKRAQ